MRLPDKKTENWLLILIILVLFFISCQIVFSQRGVNEFSLLSWSFLHGRVDFMQPVNMPEVVDVQGKEYWPHLPLPAILLMPFSALFGHPVDTRFLLIGANLLVAFLVYSFVSKKARFSKADSVWLAIFYLFSGPYIINVFYPWTFYQAHVLTTIFLFLSLREFYGRRRYGLIGIYGALILLTRYTAFFALLFFPLMIILNKENWLNKAKKIFIFSQPIIAAVMIVLGYNYLRFQNFWQTGYMLARGTLDHPPAYGIFHWRYFAGNFINYFIKNFQFIYDIPSYYQGKGLIFKFPYLKSDHFGAVSVIVSMPLYLYLFAHKAWQRHKDIIYLLITSFLPLLVLLCYFYNGWPQVGPRYLNDFLPLLFAAMVFSWPEKRLLTRHKLLILFSSALNVYLLIVTFYLNL